MSGYEEPTFDPGKLPGKAGLELEAAHDLQLIEEGASPHEIAWMREALEDSRWMHAAIHEEILKPYYEEFGVDREEDLPVHIQSEIQLRKAEWFREWRGGVYNDDGEIVNE